MYIEYNIIMYISFKTRNNKICLNRSNFAKLTKRPSQNSVPCNHYLLFINVQKIVSSAHEQY